MSALHYMRTTLASPQPDICPLGDRARRHAGDNEASRRNQTSLTTAGRRGSGNCSDMQYQQWITLSLLHSAAFQINCMHSALIDSRRKYVLPAPFVFKCTRMRFLPQRPGKNGELTCSLSAFSFLKQLQFYFYPSQKFAQRRLKILSSLLFIFLDISFFVALIHY